jgi:hypothetical protein
MYLDGLRRTRVAGIIYAAAMAIFTVLTVGDILEQARLTAAESDTALNVIKVDAADFSFLTLSYYIAVPVLAFMAFSFLYKRNTSDFYHSIPVRREALALSYTSAVITWAVVGIAVSALPSAAVLAVSPYVSVDWTEYFTFLLMCAVLSILVAGLILVAASITGRLFSGVAVLFVMTFLPFFTLLAFVEIIVDISFLITESSQIIPFLDSYQLIYSLIKLDFTPAQSLITAGLGIVFIFLGTYLFKKRKSEIAETPASPVVYRIIRTAVAFMFTLPCCAVIAENFDSEEGIREFFNGDDLIMTIVFLFLAVIVYYVFELMATRNFRGFKKATMQIVYVFIADAFFIGAIFGANALIVLDNPSPEEIDWVSFDMYRIATPAIAWEHDPDLKYDGLDPAYEGYVFLSSHEIFSDNICSTRFEDIETVRLVSNRLSKAIETSYGKTKDEWFADSEQDALLSTRDYPADVTIKANGRTIKRTLYLSQEEWLAVSRRVFEADVAETVFALPDYDSLSEIYILNAILPNGYDNEFHNKEALEKIYNQYKEEFEALTENQKLGLLFQTFEWNLVKGSASKYAKYAYYDSDYIRIHIVLEIDGEEYFQNLSLGHLTPKALNMYSSYRRQW